MVPVTLRQIVEKAGQASRATPGRIAVLRTLTPNVWAAVVLLASQRWGIDLVDLVADALNVSSATAAVLGQAVTMGVLYLLGRFNPGWLERVLLAVPVAEQGYVTTAGGRVGDPVVSQVLSAATPEEAQRQWMELMDAVDAEYFRNDRP